MTKPTIRIHNLETNEVIDREMTDAEFDAYQAQQATDAADAAAETEAETETQAAKAAAEAKLVALGLTVDDLKALGL